METISNKEIEDYIEKQLPEFYRKRLEGLERLNLKEILKRKNPYLFRVKHNNVAHDLVKGILDAHISSSDEAIFGNWLEALAIFINSKVYGG
ncbi:MAG: PmeII family type II restriction endonuclease, partial [Candidatus Cloacimonadaceae bacterium]